MNDSLTPMMQQYRELKARDPDALLLFRMGDFYEMFGEDAERASSLLGLTLTSRDKGADALPMAGFPHPAMCFLVAFRSTKCSLWGSARRPRQSAVAKILWKSTG